MPKELIVTSSSLEVRLAILEDDQVSELFIERTKNKGILGNICKGKVTKVLPGMQAAFVDIGLERNAFLYVSDFFEDYDEFETYLEGDDRTDRYLKQETRDDRRRSRQGRGRRSRRQPPPRPSRVEQRKAPSLPKLERIDCVGPVKALFNGSGLILPDSLPLPTVPLTRRRPEAERVGRILPDRIEPLVVLPRRLFEVEAPRAESAEKPAEGGEFVNGGTEPIESRVRFHPDLLSQQSERIARSETSPVDRSMASPRQVSLRTENRRNLSVRHEAPSVRRRRPIPSRGNARNQISDLLKEGQEILVQISKEAIGKKGARITSHVALPGRYMVYMPTVDHVGVSRRIVSDKERARLRRIVMENRGPTGRGFIVRTAGENHDEADLIRDIQYLTKLWDDIRIRADKSSAPVVIHSEPGIIERILRDHLSDDFRALRVDDEQVYGRIVEFVSRFNPALVNRVHLYSKPVPIFEEFNVSAEIEKALKEKVWLKSGGHCVINQTEALVAIDVNTGKFVGSTNSLEDTITKTNLEAVKEVVRQIRLRDLGGIIIIDFIDMDERRNRQKVMDALQEELRRDKAPSKILQFNEFGLVAITRKRVKQSLEKVLCQPCQECGGTGRTKSIRTICYTVHREARKMMSSFGSGRHLTIRCHPEVGKALRDAEAQVVKEIEAMTGKKVTIKLDPSMHVESFDLIDGPTGGK